MSSWCQNCSKFPVDPSRGQLYCYTCQNIVSQPLQQFPDVVASPSQPWLCPTCNSQNPAGQQTCWYCKKVNLSLVPMPPSTINTESPPWVCKKCGYAFNTNERCNNCRELKEQPASAAQLWTCMQCSYEYNTKDSPQCTRCRCQNPYMIVQPAPQAAPPAYQQGYQQPAAGVGIYGGNAGYGQQADIPQPYIPQTGQKTMLWKCLNCQYEYNTDTACLKCYQLKAGQPENDQSQKFTGPWRCPSCGLDSNTSAVCKKCQKPRPANTNPSPEASSAPWKCLVCKYEYNQGATCIHCPQNKPGLKAGEKQKGDHPKSSSAQNACCILF